MGHRDDGYFRIVEPRNNAWLGSRFIEHGKHVDIQAQPSLTGGEGVDDLLEPTEVSGCEQVYYFHNPARRNRNPLRDNPEGMLKRGTANMSTLGLRGTHPPSMRRAPT